MTTTAPHSGIEIKTYSCDPKDSLNHRPFALDITAGMRISRVYVKIDANTNAASVLAFDRDKPDKRLSIEVIPSDGSLEYAIANILVAWGLYSSTLIALDALGALSELDVLQKDCLRSPGMFIDEKPKEVLPFLSF